MSNLDRIMAEDPLNLTAQDIDTIIEFQRQARRNFDAGIKPKKETGPKADLGDLISKMTGKVEVPKTPLRRI